MTVTYRCKVDKGEYPPGGMAEVVFTCITLFELNEVLLEVVEDITYRDSLRPVIGSVLSEAFRVCCSETAETACTNQVVPNVVIIVTPNGAAFELPCRRCRRGERVGC